MRFFPVLFAAALLFSGCAADLSGLKTAPGVVERARVENLAAFEQEPGQCGAAALATLTAWGAPPGVAQETLAPRLYNPERKGAFPFDLTREARASGLLAYRLTGGLAEVLAELSAGRPVGVLENRGLSFFDVYHWSVAGGFDLGFREITLYEGEAVPRVRSLDTFSRTFERGGSVAFVALPPPHLPLFAPQEVLLAAISELEKAAGSAKAAPFYQAYANRFPHLWMGRFALANALYAGGDRLGAEKALRIAIALGPERPEPLNNLAMISLEAGKPEEARRLGLEALHRALALKLDPAPYEATLKEAGGK